MNAPVDDPWTLMRAALRQARAVQNAADSQANELALMLVGRLRKVNGATLKRLKRELRQFDSRHYGMWRDR